MDIAIIDADLIGCKKHRFPNLASMKISGYYKNQGHNIHLVINYDELKNNTYDQIFLSKVFTDTQVPKWVLNLSNIKYGGTGFFYDKAPDLLYEIEHHMPNYNLYDNWIQKEINRGINPKQFDDYLNSSIGFLTRGCFRKCPFCVNKKYNHAFKHSSINEFLDISRPRISLWDDNFLAYKDWRSILIELKNTNKYFQFRQGLDIRLMTKQTALFFKDTKYYGDFIFAFDNIKDADLIKKKLTIWKKYINKTTKLYVSCGFDRQNQYNNNFWKQDIIDTFERIKILMTYGCLPYIMRYKDYINSPYKGMYINLARWCNQPSFFKKKSFREFCLANQNLESKKKCATVRYMEQFENNYPNITQQYFDLKYEKLNQYK